MERLETIAFSVSLLLLIVAISADQFILSHPSTGSTNIFILSSMILLSVTTPLSVMVERKHAVSSTLKKGLVAAAVLLFIATGIAYAVDKLHLIEYVISVTLSLSVILSMILFWRTEPVATVAHMEKTNKIFSVLFMILVPASLLANYAFSKTSYDLKIGFTLPLLFTLLAGNKLIDDLKRLSIIKTDGEPIERHYKNYALSKREQDVAALLIKGKTYNVIAEELFISLPTVKTHSSNIYKKCQVNNRHELTILLTS